MARALVSSARAFLALALHSDQKPVEALRVALQTLAPRLPRYQRAVRAYADELRTPDRVRVIAVGLLVQDGWVLGEEYAGSEASGPFLRLPGGGVEFGERADDAVRREFAEELGVTLDDAHLLGIIENIFERPAKRGHEIVYVYGIRCAELEALPRDGRLPVRDADTTVGWLNEEAAFVTAPDDGHAAGGGRVHHPAEHLGEHVEGQAEVGKARDGERGHGPRPHGVDVREAVDGGDGAVVIGIVDHGGEHVDRAHQRQVVGEAHDAAVVGRADADDHVRVLVERQLALDLRQLGGAELRRSTGTGGELRQSDFHGSPGGAERAGRGPSWAPAREASIPGPPPQVTAPAGSPRRRSPARR